MVNVVGKTTQSSPSAETAEVLSKILRQHVTLDQASKSVCTCIKRHLSSRFPGSVHWNPDKVTDKHNGIVEIDIPGASRAWHDVTILPTLKRKLAIPFPIARGTSTSDWPDAFVVKKKSGSMFLAQQSGDSLTALFALVDRAF